VIDVTYLHPDCPDLARLAPTRDEALIRARAARVEVEREERLDKWSRGFTRRRFLAGAGMAGVASLGTQLVTTRVSFAAAPTDGTLVVVFLRGGMDGLSVVIPVEDPNLLAARPKIAVRGPTLLPLDRGFALHPALAPLHNYWKQGKFTAVPAVSAPDISRSHFQAQDCIERGGSATGTTEGWLDRVLDALGVGTTFRAVGQGSIVPRSLAGDQPSISLNTVDSFALGGWEGVKDKTRQALATLYTGLDNPIATDVANVLGALDTVDRLTTTEYTPSVAYPDGEFAKGLIEVARLIKSDVGLRVACIDLGGWDTHTNQGTLDGGDMKNLLTPLGTSLAAFAADLGPRLDKTTIVTMTEFGRRVEQNANNGSDHGHGSTALLLGGGLAGNTIHGEWPGLAPEALDLGDVAGANDYRNVLGELVVSRLGVAQSDLAAVFPGHQYTPIGITA
jgi:uncharacterized protein (DUF1501 family)